MEKLTQPLGHSLTQHKADTTSGYPGRLSQPGQDMATLTSRESQPWVTLTPALQEASPAPGLFKDVALFMSRLTLALGLRALQLATLGPAP